MSLERDHEGQSEMLLAEHIFDGLVAVVQYRRRDEGSDGYRWFTMAAFDLRTIAERYCDDCRKQNRPWEYRVKDVPGLEHL